MSQVVLITGCSTGIGRAVAEHLTAAGYTVVATARAAESLDGVAASTKLTLDPSPDSPATIGQRLA
jgi:NADP-dependent 3-hydroxy acid dehydrogenase YdfG